MADQLVEKSKGQGVGQMLEMGRGREKRMYEEGIQSNFEHRRIVKGEGKIQRGQPRAPAKRE